MLLPPSQPPELSISSVITRGLKVGVSAWSAPQDKSKCALDVNLLISGRQLT